MNFNIHNCTAGHFSDKKKGSAGKWRLLWVRRCRGTNRNKSGLRQERQKGSSLVTPQVFHSVTYGLHKDKEITRNIFVMLAHDRKHVIQKSKITVITLPTPFLSLLPCSTFPVFQKGPQSGQSSCSRGRPARI